jgi:hypothetical protein
MAQGAAPVNDMYTRSASSNLRLWFCGTIGRRYYPLKHSDLLSSRIGVGRTPPPLSSLSRYVGEYVTGDGPCAHSPLAAPPPSIPSLSPSVPNIFRPNIPTQASIPLRSDQSAYSPIFLIFSQELMSRALPLVARPGSMNATTAPLGVVRGEMRMAAPMRIIVSSTRSSPASVTTSSRHFSATDVLLGTGPT